MKKIENKYSSECRLKSKNFKFLIVNNSTRFSMRLQEEVRKCVAFICFPKTLINGTKDVSVMGTGFFASIPSKYNSERNYLYLVTAKHIANKLTNKPFSVRLNNKKGSCDYLNVVDRAQWFYHPSDESVDVAVLPCAPSLEYDLKSVSSINFLTDEDIKQNKIGLGDEVFITGLFAHAYGSQKNQPIIRTGNIAMIPDEPLATETGNIEAYLIEARSIGGLSGSPAFVFESNSIGMPRKFYLLGLMHGHWEILPDLKNDSFMAEEMFGKVNMGIAVVVPAKKILEVLNHPILSEDRGKEKKLKN